MLSKRGIKVDMAFCPGAHCGGARNGGIVRSAANRRSPHDQAGDRAEKFFRILTNEVIRLQPEEAELAKLFTNTWRYIKFATANQFWMMANDYGSISSGYAGQYATTIRGPPICRGRVSRPARAC